MQKTVVRQGDTVTLTLNPPAALTPPLPPAPLPRGTAGFRIEQHPACVPDDIESWVIPSVGYSTLTFPISGTGRVEFKVPPANRAKYARASQGETEVVVNGGPLDVVFTVVGAASNPSGTDTPGATYQGKAILTCPRVRPVTAG
ncbi:hypothetical protein J1792_24710 [Streptomyces triculaminicus]|uniref:Uncharacterized protein n=2 Tax=Streptomyces TaxID=1883 RepID=A0A939FP68_9ACTN|nr:MULTISPECIES: hypothetical protein [Streptomyces]MBO0655861.1 hypothetical protein [Streptomyces triculaminicus]QSY49874.1 hypothetical protein J3S04_01860 [Streptomyces griseocarneus]